MLLYTVICIVCKQKNFPKVLGLGERPLSSEFSERQVAYSKFFDIRVVLCENCLVVQLENPPSYEELIPRSTRSLSIEPEDHLDDLFLQLDSEFGKSLFAKVVGVSYKDRSLIVRIASKYPEGIYFLPESSDGNFLNQNAGIETIQNAISSGTIPGPNHSLKYSLIVARHILEHANDFLSFVENLQKLLDENGCILFEIPDCKKNILSFEYTMVWEEHITYWDQQSLCATFKSLGYEVLYSKSFELPYENSTVVLIRKSKSYISLERKSLQDVRSSLETRENFMNYIETYGEIFELINNKMQGLRESNYKVGIFGAGHLACAFIHYFKTSQFFDFCFDDTPSKVGKFLPGTTIPIIKPTVDNLSKVQVCLTAISLSNEGALMQRFTEFTSQGGKFLSIFRNSSNSIFDY